MRTRYILYVSEDANQVRDRVLKINLSLLELSFYLSHQEKILDNTRRHTLQTSYRYMALVFGTMTERLTEISI